MSVRGFWFRLALVVALFFALFATSELRAQELPLKRELPPHPAGACSMGGEGPSRGEPASPTRRDEAEQLAADANEAAILGDHLRARAFLREAARLDPASPLIPYRLGRLLETVGEADEAVREYCRYLALTPEGVEAGEVRERVERLAGIPAEGALPERVRHAFEEGVRAFDRGEYDLAIERFSDVLVDNPSWADAYYNRGVAHRRAGRSAAGAADLEAYLQREPSAADRSRVRERIAAARPAPLPRAPSSRSPATALATGMLVPGMGHFYSGRPGLGLLVLAGAVGSASAALSYRRVDVECLSIPIDGECPPGQERGREESRPLLVPGLAAAVAITLGGAIHAYRGVRRSARSEASAGSRGSGVRPPPLGMLETTLPALSSTGVETRLRLEPEAVRGAAGLRATLELRFR